MAGSRVRNGTGAIGGRIELDRKVAWGVMEPFTLVKLDRRVFTDHLEFWKQMVHLDQTQRMCLWASIQRQAMREIGLDYAWDTEEPVPVLPFKEEAPGIDVLPDAVGHYL